MVRDDLFMYLFMLGAYTLIQKFGVSKIFLKEASSAHQGWIYLITNTVKTVIL